MNPAGSHALIDDLNRRALQNQARQVLSWVSLNVLSRPIRDIGGRRSVSGKRTPTLWSMGMRPLAIEPCLLKFTISGDDTAVSRRGSFQSGQCGHANIKILDRANVQVHGIG